MTIDKPKRRARDRPIYMRKKSVIDPDTGQRISCLVPASATDSKLLNERNYTTGSMIRATFKQTRNPKFHRYVHQLGSMVVENIEGFEHLDSHEAIKRLQADTGLFCELREIDAGPIVDALLAASGEVLGDAATAMLGSVLPEIRRISIQQPESIAFDSLDESDFKKLWSGICQHLIKTYWHTMTEERINEMVGLMPD